MRMPSGLIHPFAYNFRLFQRTGHCDGLFEKDSDERSEGSFFKA